MRKHNFGWAIKQLKAGNKVRCSDWAFKSVWLKLQIPDVFSFMTEPYIYIEFPLGHPSSDNRHRAPWIMQQSDILSNNWVLAEDNNR